jgi:hypothetical protein
MHPNNDLCVCSRKSIPVDSTDLAWVGFACWKVEGSDRSGIPVSTYVPAKAKKNSERLPPIQSPSKREFVLAIAVHTCWVSANLSRRSLRVPDLHPLGRLPTPECLRELCLRVSFSLVARFTERNHSNGIPRPKGAASLHGVHRRKKVFDGALNSENTASVQHLYCGSSEFYPDM